MALGIPVVMGGSVPQSVHDSQPLSVRMGWYAHAVKFVDPKTVLWGNICRLAEIGEDPTIDAVHAKVGVGRGTVQRIKEGQAATRLSSLTSIAEKLGVPTWRLLQDKADRTGAADKLAQLCDEITDDRERERFIAMMERCGRLAISGGLSAALAGLQLVLPDLDTTLAPQLGGESQTGAAPSAHTDQLGAAKARRPQRLGQPRP